ncbi:MAG TPA: hypothetical protein VFS14_01555 [Candidatus Saccharimonadales bacterium]|nr:hypothetical protein [Candidatus Saccharimonadales bacterium]
MSERQSVQPITRIRQELVPSGHAVQLINGFLEEPDPALRFYTTAEREVPLDDYHRGEYEVPMHDAEAVVRRLASKALLLAGPVFAAERGRMLRLSFGVDAPSERSFAELVDAMNDIAPGSDEEARIYVDILKTKIVRDREKRGQAGALLSSQLRHPAYRRRLYVSHPKLVTRDIMLRPVPDILPIAADE